MAILVNWWTWQRKVPHTHASNTDHLLYDPWSTGCGQSYPCRRLLHTPRLVVVVAVIRRVCLETWWPYGGFSRQDFKTTERITCWWGACACPVCVESLFMPFSSRKSRIYCCTQFWLALSYVYQVMTYFHHHPSHEHVKGWLINLCLYPMFQTGHISPVIL
jgi:hypothetical protein